MNSLSQLRLPLRLFAGKTSIGGAVCGDWLPSPQSALRCGHERRKVRDAFTCTLQLTRPLHRCLSFGAEGQHLLAYSNDQLRVDTEGSLLGSPRSSHLFSTVFSDNPTNWDDLELMWSYIFDRMGVDPTAHPILITQVCCHSAILSVAHLTLSLCSRVCRHCNSRKNSPKSSLKHSKCQRCMLPQHL